MVLGQAGLPVEGIALIIGVDRLLDMVRTAVNVTGDTVVSVIVAKSEGQFDEAVFNGSAGPGVPGPSAGRCPDCSDFHDRIHHRLCPFNVPSCR